MAKHTYKNLTKEDIKFLVESRLKQKNRAVSRNAKAEEKRKFVQLNLNFTDSVSITSQKK